MPCTRRSLVIRAAERRETGRRTGDGGVFAAMPRVAPVSALYGVSGRSSLRNRPEVVSGARLC